VLSVIGGYVGIPKVLSFGKDINYVEHFLAPVFVQEHNVPEASMEGNVPAGIHHEGVGFHGEGVDLHHEVGYGVEMLLMVIAVMGALFAIYVAWEMYRRRPEIPKKLAERFRGLYQLISNKYWVDELYDAVFVRPYYWLCRRSRDFDTWVVDGTVNGIRHVTVGLSHISNFNDKWFVDGMVNLIGYGIKGSSWLFRKVQTGIVQNYAAAIILGTFILLSIFLIFL
jgi:NADH:ubiquinone oxidoreductase subunit 5 (subunit L)/multisubunit Na+/H+ antiporter MnhA subunit